MTTATDAEQTPPKVGSGLGGGHIQRAYLVVRRGGGHRLACDRSNPGCCVALIDAVGNFELSRRAPGGQTLGIHPLCIGCAMVIGRSVDCHVSPPRCLKAQGL